MPSDNMSALDLASSMIEAIKESLQEVLDETEPISVPELVARYIDQLINGCGSPECTQALCRTGTLNNSQGKPVRQYSTRSARTIAIALCAGPYPTARLCRYIAEDPYNAREPVHETLAPCDPSALDQLLSETESFKLLQEPDTSCSIDDELHEYQHRVSKLLQAAARDPLVHKKDFMSNSALVGGLVPCVEWLLDKLPLSRPASFTMVNDLVSKGYTYPPKNASLPSDENYNTWLKILDTIHHKPYLRLLGQIFQAIAMRQELELFVYRVRAELEAVNKVVPSTTHCARLFLQKFFEKRNVSPGKFLALVIWLKRLAAEHWDGRPLVRTGSVCMGVWSMLVELSNNPKRRDTATNAALDIYHMPMVWARLSTSELVNSYREFLTRGNHRGTYHIISFKPLFTMRQLTHCFRGLNHLTMRVAYSEVENSINLMRRYNGYPEDEAMPEQMKHVTQHYLLLNVSRANILQDTFDQLWQRRKDELKRPLRVRLGEVEEHEIGHDLGGVQIEFFNLVCKELFSEEAQMFITDAETGISHFRPGSLQPLYMFEMFGTLLALAIYNGITLPINLPWAFYRITLHWLQRQTASQALDLIRDGWPVLTKSMQSLLDEDIDGLEHTFPFEANGIRMQVQIPSVNYQKDPSKKRAWLPVTSTAPEVDIDSISEQLPGWKFVKSETEPAEVTVQTKDGYVSAYIVWTVFASVFPQWQAFKRGFWDSGILDARHLRIFDPSQLKSLVEGSSKLDIAALRSITQYDGFHANEPYIQQFWRVVTGWGEAKQKMLLKFVTAVERVPITGGLTFVLKRVDLEDEGEGGERLPTSSTCFGTLMLPVYRSERVLERKLGVAVRVGCEGFGTG